MCWYTFGGEPINLVLAEALKKKDLESEKTDDYGVYFSDGSRWEELDALFSRLTAADAIGSIRSNTEAEQALKFHECLPENLRRAEVVARRCNQSDLATVLNEARHYVLMHETDGSDAV